jgi:hypothetical protein
MKSLEGISFVSVFFRCFVVVVALFAPACHSIDVAPWPYTNQTDNTPPPEDGASDDDASDDGPSDDGASDGGASDDGSDQGGSGPSSIQDHYGPDPLRCDGGLCDTDNYSLCDIANNPARSRAVWPLSALFVVVGMALARKRSGRKARRSP